MEGGSKIGRIEAFVGAVLGFVIRKGCTGVPNPGDDDGIGSRSAVIRDVAGVRLGRGVSSMFNRGGSPCCKNDQARINLEKDAPIERNPYPSSSYIQNLSKSRAFLQGRVGSLVGFYFSIKTYLHVTRRRVTPRAADANRDKSRGSINLYHTTNYYLSSTFYARSRLLFVLAYKSRWRPRKQIFLRPALLEKSANMTDAEQPEKAPPVANEDERAQLEDLVTRAAAKDAIKDFNAAAELYSEATELQVKLNGEMSLDNADLLYAYGKALYNVAVSKSDVLGAKVAGEPQAQPNTTGGSSGSAKPASTSENLIENSMASGMAKKEASASEKELSENKQSKPFFQFTGDENFDESDSEDEDEEAKAGADDEDEDDFANAFEVLDLARILYQKQMDEADGGDQKGKSTEVPSDIKRLKERLADTYDLQAEISLEAERFLDAVTDLRTALDLRLSIFPLEDPSVAECHYKLSLALEFGAVSKAEESDQNDSHGPPKVDEDMRKEAATQMEKAIESCRARMAQEQKKLDSGEATDEDKATAMKRKISNVKEIVADMEQRVRVYSLTFLFQIQDSRVNCLHVILAACRPSAPASIHRGTRQERRSHAQGYPWTNRWPVACPAKITAKCSDRRCKGFICVC